MATAPIVHHDYGCPATYMREHVLEFEKHVKSLGLEFDLELRRSSPHYSSREARIAYMVFVDSLK